MPFTVDKTYIKYVNVFKATTCNCGVMNYTIIDWRIRLHQTSVVSTFVPIYLGPCGLAIFWHMCSLLQLGTFGRMHFGTIVLPLYVHAHTCVVL
jgi:hypothetical protein